MSDNDDNIIKFGSNPTPPRPPKAEAPVPATHTYRIFLKGREPLDVSGYLALTGSFFAVASTDRDGDILFVAPVDCVEYIAEVPESG